MTAGAEPLLRHYLYRGLLGSMMVLLLQAGYCAVQVYRYSSSRLPGDYHADAAVVLGAAAWDTRPSPVFRERINHAIALYQSGKVEKLAFTGGSPKKGFMTEAEVGRLFAIRQGVPEKDIVLEKESRDTYQNLANIRPVLRQHDANKIVIVSDPFHLARAAAIASDMGLNADFSPTPTSRYDTSAQSRRFFIQETLHLSGYYWWRPAHALMNILGFE